MKSGTVCSAAASSEGCSNPRFTRRGKKALKSEANMASDGSEQSFAMDGREAAPSGMIKLR